MSRLSSQLLQLLLILALALPSELRARATDVADAQPEQATAHTTQGLARARHWMAASANPLATEAGTWALRQGGSAVDAAIAMQLVLALVEPQSSGLGGGAFLLAYDAGSRRVRSYDGRETAPRASHEARFLVDGKPLAFTDAVNSGLAVGTPGLLRLLELAHRRHGRLRWAKLFEPAIRWAEQGFPVSPRLHAQIAGNRDLYAQPAARAYFYPDGEPVAVGQLLKNPALAQVLSRVARQGARAFYEGEIANDIVAAVRAHARAGDLAPQDLASYQALEREPVCSAYRSQYSPPHRTLQLCGMGPPSSGGIAVLQMLTMLEQHRVDDMMPLSLEALHYFAEAGRLAFADRDHYLADPAFVPVPVKALLAPVYLHARGAQIDSRMSMGTALPGDPVGFAERRGQGHVPDLPSTTHLVAVDRDGNGVSMTSTIESEFGSKIFVRGFLLNNQLTDFSLSPRDAQGRMIANRIEPGKRPRSSMAPMIATSGGQLYLLAGSPGGSAIINFVAKTLVGVLDWRMDVQQAIAHPNMGSRNRDIELERGTTLESFAGALREKGHRVSIMPMPSGVQAIVRDRDGWTGGADPRREGLAAGE
ncbi:MAG: gamma-glutamyltransferase [Oxalobacteraceae bacterium]